jgi:hypothetical protein
MTGTAPLPERIPEGGGEQRQGFLWSRGLAPLALLLLALAPLPENGGATIAGLPSLCLFRNLVGLPCPGCGILRSLVCCGHGRWAEAAAYHPLGPGLLAILAVWTMARLLPVPRWATAALPAAIWTGVALVLGVWGTRLGGLLPAAP